MNENSSREQVSVKLQVRVVRGFAGRLRGLIGRSPPAPGCALLLSGVSAVHGFGMRDAIDVLFLDGRGFIVRITSLAPATVASCGRARHVLEMRSGEIARLGLRPAMRPLLLLRDDIFEKEGGQDNPRELSIAGQVTRKSCARSVAIVGGILLAGALVPNNVQAAPPGELDAEVVAASRPRLAMPAEVAVPMHRLQRLEEEAEVIYRENRRDSDDALVEAYETLAELAPDRFPQAWLRIGNIRQRAGRVGEAIDAYRRVRAPVEERKALLNLTALTLEQAKLALARLDALPSAGGINANTESASSVPGGRSEAAVIGDYQRQLRSVGQNLVEQQRRRTEAAAGAPHAAGDTHIVERYTASARRNAVKAARGSLHVDPADELPARPVPPLRSRPAAADYLPRVEYLLGDPLRPQQNGVAEHEAPAAASAARTQGPTGKPPAPASGDLRDRDSGRAVVGVGVGGRNADGVRGGAQK